MAKRPARVRDDSPQILALHQYADELENIVDYYQRQWPIPFRQDLVDLHLLLVELVSRSVPGQGRLIDPDSRSHNNDPITPDGRTTREGAATKRDRGKVEWAKIRLRDLNEQIRSQLNPEARNEDARPRCRKKDCVGKDKRQRVGQKFCGWCGQNL